MDLETAVACLGIAIHFCGGLVEVVAVVAIFSYPVRRWLYQYRPPLDNPLTLQPVGCWICTAGGGLLVVGQWLRGRQAGGDDISQPQNLVEGGGRP